MADTKTKTTKHYGLRLALAGAARCFHTVIHADGLSPVIGLFHPETPTPVGAPGELSLEDAKALDGHASVPLELVGLAEDEVAKLRAEVTQAVREHRSGALEARKNADGGEISQVSDALNAVKGRE